jgi:hypothetical protein
MPTRGGFLDSSHDACGCRNCIPKAISKVLLRETVQNAKANAKEIRLVLLGDTFDLVRTDYWVVEFVTALRAPEYGVLARHGHE